MQYFSAFKESLRTLPYLLLISLAACIALRAQTFSFGNDAFANAFKLPPAGGAVIANNQSATLEPGEQHAGVPTVANSLWWRFSPATDANVLVDTTGSSFDTVLAVYRARRPDLADLIEVASTNNVGRRLQAYLKFSGQAGTTYYIAVAGSDPAQAGEVRLRVELGGEPDQTPPAVTITSPAGGVIFTNQVLLTGMAFDPAPNPSGIREVIVSVNGAPVGQPVSGTTNWSVPILLSPGRNFVTASAIDFAGNQSPLSWLKLYRQSAGPENELFTTAALLDDETEALLWSNRGASKESGEPHHAGNEGGSSIWWYWKAPADGTLLLSTAGSDFDTLLALYVGDDMLNLQTVASNDDVATGGEHSELTTAVKAGSVYRIAVDGFGGASGNVRLRHRFTAATVHALQIVSGRGGTTDPATGYFPAGATVLLNAAADPYFEFSSWERLDGSVFSYENPLPVQIHGDLILMARFVPFVFAEDFESGRLDRAKWSHGTGLGWQVQSGEVAHGNFAARSAKLTHRESSSLILTAQMAAGPGSFELKISSEPRWDTLEFFVNGVRTGVWSGDMDWQRHEFHVPSGVNRLEWRYSKDAVMSVGLDAAFVDNIDVPLVLAFGAPPRLTWTKAGEQPDLELWGEPRQSYILEGSSDLRSWTPISMHRMNSSGFALLKHAGLQPGTNRFYRLRVP